MIIQFLTVLLATQMIDIDMSPQDKKKTGVYKLSDKEKAALQSWIDTYYQKRETPTPQTHPEKHANLSENLHNGKYIKLSDGSLWNIRPDDIPVSQGWITAAEIIVSESGNPLYPNKLTNSLTGSSILAKKVDSIPKSPPPPAPNAPVKKPVEK